MLFRRILPCQRQTQYMWEFDPASPRTLQRFFGTKHEDMWKLLFKTQKTWPKTTEDLGLDCTHTATPGWTKKAERIHCPAPLPEDPTIPLLTRMLVPAPYQALEKKAKKKSKAAKGGLRRKGASDVVSEDTKTLSSHDEDEEEEEERNSPLKGGKKKRLASVELDTEASKKGRISLMDDSETNADDIHEWRPRSKPLAESLARDLPQRSSSSGNSLGPNTMESESPPRASPHCYG